MSSVFPFHLIESDGGLAFYLVVYVLTLVIHAIFMTYVLAGSAFIAWATLFPGSGPIPRAAQPLAKQIREWLPFVLSGAITAGVAPLLFVQIIYRQEFYTANLLLGWRWMVVIPVLIVAFYLLYLLKSRLIAGWSFPARCILVFTIFGCFLFVALCWTTNHLLQLERDNWGDIFATSKVFSSVVPLSLRLLTWFSGAFPTMAILAGWQLRHLQRHPQRHLSSSDDISVSADIRRLAISSLVGLVAATICGILYVQTLGADQKSGLFDSGFAWLIVLAIGLVLQVTAWTLQLKAGCLCFPRMFLATFGNLIMLTATGFVREQLRLNCVGLQNVTPHTDAATKIGGFTLFLVFTALNGLLIAYCLRLIRPHAEHGANSTTSATDSQ